MRPRPLLVAALLLALTACTGPAAKSAMETASSARTTGQIADHLGSLSPVEVSLATTIAKQQQAKVTGTFVGATAFLSQGTPFATDPACAGREGLITTRLVWEDDASFVHGGPPSMPPDGPRKALLVTFEKASGQVCSIGAMYREVGAEDTETLLYGQWPDPADS